jgi:hypothetical protein
VAQTNVNLDIVLIGFLWGSWDSVRDRRVQGVGTSTICNEEMNVNETYTHRKNCHQSGTMANLDLTVNGGYRPTIDGIISMSGDGVYDNDGWTGDEYALFTKMNMWNQGNDAKELLATGFIAYDCENKILVRI